MSRRFVYVLLLGPFFALAAPGPAPGEEAGTPPLRVGKIVVYGNKRIRSYILEREIPFKSGDLFDEEKLRKARVRLRKVPGVDYSEVRVAYTPKDSSLLISVIVTEKPTFNGRPLIRRGQQNKISLGLELWEKNFRGRSEKLTGSFLLRGNTIVTASWENPWIGSVPHLGTGVNLFYKKYNYVYDDVGSAFADAPIERYGAELELFRQLGEDTRVSLSGGFESVESTVSGATLDAEGKDTYSIVSLCLRHDSRRNPVYPWNGIFFRAVAQEIGWGNETVSIREETADLRLYKSLFGRGIIAGHGWLRYRDGDRIPFYRREHIGGSQSLRGYDYGSFHGTSSIVTGIEGRLPINFSMNLPAEDMLLGFAWHAFADAATAWENDKNLSLQNFHGSFGVGVILLSLSSSGFRFDYAWRLDGPGRFEFDIGMKF